MRAAWPRLVTRVRSERGPYPVFRVCDHPLALNCFYYGFHEDVAEVRIFA